MRRLLLTVSIALACVSAFAEQTPQGGAYDSRIKVVTYNANDVVKIVGHFGYSTDIQFAPNEKVTKIAMGDTLAWEPAPAGNHLFVKPREDNAVTNMTVVTSERVYQFSLDARASRGVTNSNSAGMFFAVRFDYPEIKAAKAKADYEARMAEAERSKLEHKLNAAPEGKNWNYYACGERGLWPSEAFDDGRFTYMRFNAAHEIPAVFVIKDDGSEAIVDAAMRGELLEVHTTAKRFILRSGKSVGCIQNRSYNPWGVYTPTNTTVPGFERVDIHKSSDVKPSAQAVPAPSRVEPTAKADGPGAAAQPAATTPRGPALLNVTRSDIE